jgi:hypothetical protein
MTVTKVLIDGGAGLNIIFADTLRKIGLDFVGMMTPMDVPFYGIVPDKVAMPLGQITLPITFGTQENYHTKFIKFEVVDFKSSYHAIFGRLALTKFMAVPHYPYLLLKMLGPNGVLSIRGDLRRSFNYDAQAIKIAAKAQADLERQEIIILAAQGPLNLDLPAKKPTIFCSTKEADVMKIDLGTGDPSKTATISTHLSPA